MKKYIYIVFSCILVLGCQDLDLIPEDTLSDGSLWDKEADYEAGANIFYTTFGGGYPQDNNADTAYTGPNSTSNGTRIAPASSGFYTGSYQNIRRCNFLIDRAILNGFEDNRFVAEVKFFRAFYYFNLVKAYGDVPFYTETLDPGSESLFDVRTDRATVIDFILSDLQGALQNLPLENELSNSEKGRITRGIAQALVARIALFEGTWAKYHNNGDDVNGRLDIAINNARSIMQSGLYELYVHAPNPDESYRYFFHEAGNDSKEQMLARRYDFNRRHGGFNNAPSTRKLADMYLCTDGLPIDQSPLFQGRSLMTSEFENRDRRFSATNVIPGAFTIDRLDQEGTGQDFPQSGDGGATDTWYRRYKFISETYLFSNGQNVQYYHALRYAEVLLIYAEALYERNGAITDEQLNESINLTRARGGVAPLSNAFAGANSLDVLEEIRRERTIELAHEGFRRDDLRRWKTAEVELPQAIMGIQFGGTEFETVTLPGSTDLRYPNPPNQDASGNVIVEPASARSFDPNKDYLEPLPTEELVLNPNLTQNPGW